MRNVKCFIGVYVLSAVLVHAVDLPKDELDKVIEDEITDKLSKDLLQSIERKFQMDLEKSVDMVLVKIKMLLRNGTTHIQDKMVELQTFLDSIRKEGEVELDKCLQERKNETTALAEKALHQMVVCGYALIGHDPAQAVTRVMELKTMITQGVKPFVPTFGLCINSSCNKRRPALSKRTIKNFKSALQMVKSMLELQIYGEKKEIYELLKVCGHDHENLRKVIKCVISKSTIIKSAMMDITNKLIEGVVDLSKLMAHGAMHEACLIEVVKSTEDEAFKIVNKVKNCTVSTGKETKNELDLFMAENNATVLDITRPNKTESVKVIPNEDKKKNENEDDKTENANNDTNSSLWRRIFDVKKFQDSKMKNKNSLAKNMVN